MKELIFNLISLYYDTPTPIILITAIALIVSAVFVGIADADPLKIGDKLFGFLVGGLLGFLVGSLLPFLIILLFGIGILLGISLLSKNIKEKIQTEKSKKDLDDPA